MLQSPSNLWQPEGIDDWSPLIQKDVMDEPFASLVRRLLPAHPIGDEAVSTREKRIKLAAELEAALGEKQPSHNNDVLLPVTLLLNSHPGRLRRQLRRRRHPPQVPEASTSWLIWFGIPCALVGLLYWFLKQRT